LVEEALRISREAGNKNGIKGALLRLGNTARFRGDYQRAQEHFEESLRLAQELGDKALISEGLTALGIVTLQQHGEHAEVFLQESLRVAWEIGAKIAVAIALAGVASAATHIEEHQRAIQLLAAADALWTSMGAVRDPCFRDVMADTDETAHAALSDAAYDEARRQGEAMSLEQAVAYALGEGG
jgi:non-specific serine/threonine protein kinase